MIITLFKSEWEAYTTPNQIIDADWNDIAETLMFFYERKEKELVPMFNLWQFDPAGEPGRKYLNKEKTEWNPIPGTIRRCSENAVGLWGLVLDCDSKLTMEQAINEVSGLEFVLYRTFNHSDLQDKFRVVIPFTRMMTKAEFELKRDDMKACFPLMDTASFSKSQAIFLHSGPIGSLPLAIRGSGAMIDPDHFIDKIIPVYEPKPHREYSLEEKTEYSKAVLKSLQSCSNVNRSGPNEGILLANIARSIGLSFAEFQQLCTQTGRQGSSIHTEDVQKQFWNLIGADAKVRAETRDKFIQAHGGTPVKVPRVSDWAQVRKKLIEKYKENK